jgi:hypothetical protein
MPMSDDVEPAAAKWRELAAEMLAAAAEMTDPEAYAVMLDIAERYERLAQFAEARSAREKPK